MATTTITSSSLAKFRECPRRYWFEYELGRVTVRETAAISFGNAWHRAMEAWWIGGPEAAAKSMIEIARDIDVGSAAKIAALLAHYDPPRDEYDVIAVEDAFEVRIQNPDAGGRSFYGYRLAGKADVVLRRKETGEVWICDHKTTSSEIVGFGPYWQALQIDAQMANYCLAYNARGFIYDVVRKPGIKLCAKDKSAALEKGINPEDAYRERVEKVITDDPAVTFQWRPHLRTEEDTAEARRDLWQQVEMHRACARDGRFPRNSSACVGRYGVCPYLDVCTGRASIDDESLFRCKATRHEELAEVPEGGAS